MKRRCFPEYRSSWFSQLAGLVLIIIGTIGLGGLKFTPGSLIGSILFISIYVSGIFLFLAGLSRWLVPVLEAARDRHSALKKITFLKDLNHKLGGSPSHTGKIALSELSTVLAFKAGAVYVRAGLGPDLVLLSSSGISEGILPAKLGRDEWKQSGKEIYFRQLNFPQHPISNGYPLGNPVILPLKSGGKLVGLSLLWPEHAIEGELPEQNLLQIWGSVLADRVAEERRKELKRIRQQTLRIMEQAESIVESQKGLESLWPAIGKTIQPLIDYQIFCLAVLDKSCQNMERYTLGPGGNLLWEKGVNCQTGKSLVEKVCHTGRMVIECQFEKQKASGREKSLPLLAACRSILAVPLKTGSRVWGVVLAGHRQPNFYHKIQGRLLTLVLHQLTFHLITRELQEGISRRDRLFNLLEKLDGKITQNDRPANRLQKISQVLATSLPVTACRISVLSQGRESLEPVSEYNLRRKNDQSVTGKGIQLEKLPWHRLALLSRKPMLVNQSDPESMMPQEEIRAAFSGPINSALLVPLVDGEKTLGMLSLIEERDWNRRPLTYPEILTAELAADRLVTLLDEVFKQRPVLNSSPETSYPSLVDATLVRKQLSDPLCGILGASELMLAKGGGRLDSDSWRYALMIRRMAERIREWVQGELTVEKPVTN